jgi:trans-aconitate 2-methyltransferase
LHLNTLKCNVDEVVKKEFEMKAEWSSAQYLKFEDHRTRPAADLLARVPWMDPSFVVDIGCGPGNSTELLVERFPEAKVLGLDSSAAMISKARGRLPNVEFETVEIEAWSPSSAPALLFANAVLQWVPHHSKLLPRLIENLGPGGCLAVQMPDNLEEQTHVSMRLVAQDLRWRERLACARIPRRLP